MTVSQAALIPDWHGIINNWEHTYLYFTGPKAEQLSSNYYKMWTVTKTTKHCKHDYLQITGHLQRCPLHSGY